MNPSGGGRYPAADAFLRPDPHDWSGITMHRIATGSASLSKNVWGDYASVHAYAGCPNTFLALSAVIPAVAPPMYHLIACANDDQHVPETSADNNCLSSAQTFTVGGTAG